MRRRVFVAAAIGAITASGIGAGAAPAFSAPVSHTITFTSHNLAALQTGSNHLLQDSELQRAGHTIGYSTSTCTFDLTTGIATCDVAASFVSGQLDGWAHIDTTDGTVNGTVTGGTGAFRHATGTITGGPSSTQPGDVALSISYHTH
jgi:hypothetical protein